MDKNGNRGLRHSLFTGAALLAVGCLGIVAYTQIVATTSRDHQSPLLEVVPAILDLGNVEQAEEIIGTVKLVNRASTPLIVTEVLPNCTCTTIGERPKDLKPHEAVPMTLKFNFGDSAGEQESKTRIRFRLANSDVVQETEFTTIANVQRHYTVSPAVVLFTIGEPAEKRVELKCDGPDAISILSAKSNRRCIKPAVSEDGQVVTLSYDHTERVDRIAGAVIRITTTSQRVPTCEVRVAFEDAIVK